MKRFILLVYILLSAIVLKAQIPGALDLSFGNFGKTLLDWNGDLNRADAIKFTADGGMVVCGTNGYLGGNNSCLLAKFTSNGLLDESFGTNGIVQFGYGGETSYANDLIIQSEGRILVAGISAEAGNVSIGLARFTSSGEPDNTFGFSGKLIVNIGEYETANTIVSLSNNKFAITGSIDSPATNLDMLVMRFLSNGSTDVSFGTNGYISLDLNNSSTDMPRGMIFHNIKFTIASYAFKQATDAVALVRLNADGSLDTGFGVGGKSVIDGFKIMDMIAEPGSQMAFDYQGRIVVSGQFLGLAGTDPMLLRFLSNGYPDNSFGDFGMAVYQITGDNELQALAVQADGKIVAAGSSNSSNRNTFIMRVLDNGDLDPAFGMGNGYSVHQLGQGNSNIDGARAMLIQNNNKAVLAGYADTQNNSWDFCISRYYLGVVTGGGNEANYENLNAFIDPVYKNRITITGEFNINKVQSISLLNAAGQICHTWNGSQINYSGNNIILNLNRAAEPGVYLLQLSGQNILASAKLICF